MGFEKYSFPAEIFMRENFNNLLNRKKLSFKKIQRDKRVNIVRDYKRAFGKKLPVVAVLAIMSDTDNTRESSTAFLDYILIEVKQ